MFEDLSPSFSAEKIEELLLRFSEGELLSTLCKEEGMPTRATIYNWRRTNEEFDDAFIKAREMQVDLRVDEILTIADDTSKDFKDVEISPGVFVRQPDLEHMNRVRTQIDTRKWIACKLYPKMYGDKLQQEISGKNGAPLVTPVIELVYEREQNKAEAPSETDKSV